MKKLFLQDGKLMLGDFQEEPSKPGPMSHQEFFTEYYEDELPAYHKAVEAAKASAVEVVNPEIFPYSLDGHNLNNIPEGWTVEIETQYWTYDPIIGANNWRDSPPLQDDCLTRQIARLIPLKEQSSGIAAVGVAEYEDVLYGLSGMSFNGEEAGSGGPNMSDLRDALLLIQGQIDQSNHPNLKQAWNLISDFITANEP